jgi:class 3 adenylate cyclase/predicted ATPase
MDLGSWLRSLGLEQYEPAFRENAIDESLLPSLTAEDLKDLGVGIVGHRRKLLDAIAVLRADVNTKAAQTGTLPTIDRSRDTAERRQVTVMFSDLVGSTALSARMDPEDLREVISSYQKCVAETVRRFDGFVAKYMGDGVLVYFGYPHAHEDDAERAVRAGLEMIASVSALASPISLQTRVGIATGLVVVGDLIGSGSAQERGIVGETPNLAARLQGIAEPNMVVIAESTRRLLGSLFELRELGAKELKGIAGSVHVWAALRASFVESRFEALHASGLTALVGREEESELLLRRWARAKNGEGQVVLLSGEAGIGKSRLTAALLERLAEPHTRLRYFCSPQHTDSALYPIIRQMERAAGLAHDDSSQARLDKLDALLAQTSTSAQDAALFAEMLSLTNDGRYPVIELTPQQRRQRTLEELSARMEALTRASPVLIIFEDVHWIDATTLEVLGRAVDQIQTLRVLLIVTFRPEFDPPWIGRPYVAALTINRLGQRDIDAMIDHLVGSKRLPASIRQDIIKRTDGIPLFVEEMTKAVLESGCEGEAPRTESAAPSPSAAVPASLQASLMARLDRLGPAKEVAQVGAAIGRQFSYLLLASVVRQREAELGSALDRLITAGLLFRQGAPPHATYLFKHALVQDTAYATLLRSQRQELHARIAKVLEEEFQETIGAHPETLAHHYSQAGLVDLAIQFWGRAGARSADRSAHYEAVGHFGCALDLVGKLPPSHQRDDERELELTLALAVSLIAVDGFGSIRVEECAVRAKGLSDKLYGSQNRFAAQRVAWNSSLMRQPVPGTAALARDLVGLAEEDGNPAKLAVAHRAFGYSLLIAGQFREAAETLARGATLADTGLQGEFAIYGEHPSMVCRAYGGQVKILMGFPESGMSLIKTAVAHARHQDNAHSLAWALAVAAHSSQSQHESAATARFASEAIEMAREHRLPQWLALGERCKGWAIHQLGDFEGGLNLMRQGVKRWYETGATLHTTHCEICLAESYLLQGDAAAARSHLSAARAHCTSYGEKYLVAEIDRLEALLLQSEGAPTEMVKECLAKALDVARHQGARLFELRSATALAQIIAEHNEHKAVDILAPIYNWFTEGLGTSDLKEAKALLDRLA